MILVIDLLRNIFIAIFVILFALEIILVVCLISIYSIPVDQNAPLITTRVDENAVPILRSINFLITRKIYDIEVDLLTIGKHMKPFVLGVFNDTESDHYRFKPNAKFLENFHGCMLSPQEAQSTAEAYKIWSPGNDDSDIIDINLYVRHKLLMNGMEGFINGRFDIDKEPLYDKISYRLYDRNSLDLKDYEQSVCYLTTILKSLNVNNLNELMETNVYRYLFFLDNNLFVYPMDNMTPQRISRLNYYRTTAFGCKDGRFAGKECFSSFINFFSNDYNIRNSIYFDDPTLSKELGYGARACMWLPIGIVSNSYICVDFTYKYAFDIISSSRDDKFMFFLGNFRVVEEAVTDGDAALTEGTPTGTGSGGTVGSANATNTTADSEIYIFYSNQNDLINIDKNVFDSSYLGKYQINSTTEDRKLTLFHGIFYNMFLSFNLITYDRKVVSSIISQYENIKGNLTALTKESDGQSDCEFRIQTFNTTMSYIDYLLGFSSFKRQPHLNNDTFLITISSIFVNSTEYDPDRYVFANYNYNRTGQFGSSQAKCKKNTLFYSFSLTQTGSNTLFNRIYFILILKVIRSFFLFMCSLLFLTIIFFIVMVIYTKFLIAPIKHIRIILDELIKDRKESVGFTPMHNSNLLNENLELETQADINNYKNQETKKLEDLLNFLQKIITMKNSGRVNYRERSRIYIRFLGFLEDLGEREYYRQCLLIIAYSKFQDSKFDEAFKCVSILIDKTSADEKEIIKNSDNIEQKILNLPNLISSGFYFNDFTVNEIPHSTELTNRFLKLRLFKQKILYFSGLLRFLEFESKKNKEENLHLLEDALVSLRKSLAICSDLNISPFKCILNVLLIARCFYEMKDYISASYHLKEALVRFCELNKFMFEKKVFMESVDPRIIFIVVNVISEQIFYQTANVCYRIGKKQLAAWVYSRLLEVNFFISKKAQIGIVYTLNEILFEIQLDREYSFKSQEMQNKYFLSKFRFAKASNRMNNLNKQIGLVMSQQLLSKFTSTYELKEVLIKSIGKYVNNSDLIFYCAFDQMNCIRDVIEINTKEVNLRRFDKMQIFCRNYNTKEKHSDSLSTVTQHEEKSEKLKNDSEQIEDELSVICEESDEIQLKSSLDQQSALQSIFNACKYAIDQMTEEYDQYVFLFLYAEEFRFNSLQEASELLKLSLQRKTSLYVFLFNDMLHENKLIKLKKYLNDMVEGYILIVKNFKIIEECFQNISILGDFGDRRNILSYNFENHNYIL